MRLYTLAFFLAACPMHAMPITYTWQTVSTGTIGSITFDNALVTITCTGDTSNVVLHHDAYYNLVNNPTVTISGIGTADFTQIMMVYTNPITLQVGSVHPLLPVIAIGPAIILNPPEIGGMVLGTRDPGFWVPYDLTTSFGPITGTSIVSCCAIGFNGLGQTTLGTLRFTDTSHERTTFTATTGVPEPTGFTLLALGLTSLSAIRFIRRKPVGFWHRCIIQLRRAA